VLREIKATATAARSHKTGPAAAKFKSGRSKQRPYQFKNKFKGERAGGTPAYRQAGRRYERQRQRRPPKGGRYKFSWNDACTAWRFVLLGKLGRSKQRPYNGRIKSKFKSDSNCEEPAGRRRYLFAAGLLPYCTATDVAA